MVIINLPTRIQTDIIQWFSLTPWDLYWLIFKPFAEINLAEQPFQLDSWTQHILIPLWPIVSTISLTLPCILPTFHKDTCNLHILHTWCGRSMTIWIDPHLTFSLLETTPSLLDMAPLYDITLFDILHDLIEAESFTAGCHAGLFYIWVLLFKIIKVTGEPKQHQKEYNTINLNIFLNFIKFNCYFLVI